MWAEPAQITGPDINPKNNGPISAQNGWANLDPKYFLFFLGQARPSQLGWARIGPAQLQMNYLQNVNNKFAFCMQLCSCRRRSEMGGNLAEEKELLLLAWREVGGGAGGRNGGSVGCLWRRKKEEEAEDENLQRGEGRPHGGCPYHRWGFEFVGRLRRLLLVEEKSVVALVGGWNGEEREGKKNCRNVGRGASFWPTLDPIFSSFRPWNAALFIGGGRGTFCL